MALWKNASGTAAKAVQQAKIISEVSRLNALVSDEKKQLDNLYYQLGAAYAQIHHDDYEGELAGFMGAILASEQKIQSYQAQIQDVKGIVCCSKCGAEVPKGVAFCSGCGTPIPRQKEANSKVCSNCGAALAENVRFCTYCGTPVAKVEEPVAQPEEEIPVEEKRLCASCGAELEEDSIFCAECGTKVS